MLREGTLIKAVFQDETKTKVVKGKIIKEEEFTYSILTEDQKEVVLGKKTIISLMEVD